MACRQLAALYCVDRHENRGWTAILANRIHLAYPERRIRYPQCGDWGTQLAADAARFDADILAHQPHWLLLSAGVVEVRRVYQPDRAQERVPLDEYVSNLTCDDHPRL